MLASGRFGTEAQLQASGGQAFRTAGQLAAGAMPMAARRIGTQRVIPTADELSNLGTAARRGATPPMFEVGGQRLGVLQTEADEARESVNRQMQSRALQAETERATRAQEAEAEFGRQKELIALQGREARATARARTTPTPAIKPPTEGQERNAVYYGLMSNASRELNALRDDPSIRPLAITLYLNTPGATLGRGLLNDAEQQFIRAAQDFTAGVLRKETGAAATKSEVAMTLERYIEMGGDQPGSRQAKSAARERVTSTMAKAAAPALRYYASLGGEDGDTTATDTTATRPPLSSFWED